MIPVSSSFPDAGGDLSLSATRTRIADLLGGLGTPVPGIETVALNQALDRIAADEVLAPIDVPPWDNSAMDGYAFDSACLGGGATVRLRVLGRALAGRPWSGVATPDGAVRIMTGAAMPAGCDSVVPQEVVEVEADGCIAFDATRLRPGANRRRAGDDWRRATPVLRAGARLRPAEVGVLASLGIERVAVRQRLRVAVFSTGDELRRQGEPLVSGAIYDSNRFTLAAMLRRLGAEPIDLGIVPDEPDALRRVLAEAARVANAVITSGGVSAGDADHVRAAVAEHGQIDFWKLAFRPGRPFACGHLCRADGQPVPFFGLPGNPAAVIATFYCLVRDALLHAMGALPAPLPHVPARAETALGKRPGRTEVLRGLARRDASGNWQVASAGSQSSGTLHAMLSANCLIVLSSESGPIAAGDTVDVVFFEGLI